MDKNLLYVIGHGYFISCPGNHVFSLRLGWKLLKRYEIVYEGIYTKEEVRKLYPNISFRELNDQRVEKRVKDYIKEYLNNEPKMSI